MDMSSDHSCCPRHMIGYEVMLNVDSSFHGTSPSQVDIGQMRIRFSNMTARTRNTKYMPNMVRPNVRLIFQRHMAMEKMTKRSMRKSSTMAQKRPLELTVTG